MERKNLITGAIWITMFIILGAYLEIKLGSGGSEWQNSLTRQMWKTAHLHGALFGILNILYGILIKIANLKGKFIQTGSILAILGAFLFPAALFMGGINFKFVYIAPLGGISMILAWLIMVITVIKEGSEYDER